MLRTKAVKSGDRWMTIGPSPILASPLQKEQVGNCDQGLDSQDREAELSGCSLAVKRPDESAKPRSGRTSVSFCYVTHYSI